MVYVVTIGVRRIYVGLVIDFDIDLKVRNKIFDYITEVGVAPFMKIHIHCYVYVGL